MIATRPRAALCLGAILLAGTVAAQSAGKPFSHMIKPRGVAEECFKLAGGESVGYAFESTVPVDFNIHFHRGEAVEYPVKIDGASRANDRFSAPSTEEFCLMWTNRTPGAVSVKGVLSP